MDIIAYTSICRQAPKVQIIVRPTPEQTPKGEKLDRFVPWQELAAALGVGFTAINAMMRRGELPHMTKIGLRRSVEALRRPA